MKSIHDNFYHIAINKLIVSRKKNGLAQAEVAKRWGRSQSILAKIETYERRIDIIEYLILAKIVHLDALALVSELNELIEDDRNKK